MPNRVVDPDVDEISTVRRPANQHGLIVLAKSAEGDGMPTYFDATGRELAEDELEEGDVVQDREGALYEISFVDETDDEGEDETDDETDEDAFADEGELVGVGKSAASAVRHATHEVGGGFKAGTIMGRNSRKAAGAAKMTRAADYVSRGGRARGAGARAGFYNSTTSTGRKVAHVGGATAVAGGAAAGGVAADRRLRKSGSASSLVDTLRDTIAKAVGGGSGEQSAILSAVEEIAKRADAAEARVDALVGLADGERDLRLTREYIAKAAEYNVPVDARELGPVLYRMAEGHPMSKADCEVIHKALTVAGETLYEVAGYDGAADASDPYAVIDAVVAERTGELIKSRAADGTIVPLEVAKSHAVVGLFDDNPEAYGEYKRQRNG